MGNISNISKGSQGTGSHVSGRPDRRAGVLATAREEGLLGVKDKAIGGRVPASLLEAAKSRSGIQSDSELLLYALSKVALEDDFGHKLVARNGRVPRDIELGI
jgi:hypothetical protein